MAGFATLLTRSLAALLGGVGIALWVASFYALGPDEAATAIICIGLAAGLLLGAR